MTIWETILIALGVSLDAFAMALAIGLSLPRVTIAIICRTAAALTIPSCIMPIVSLQLASHCLEGFQLADELFVPLVLSWMGAVMISGNDLDLHSIENKITWSSLILLGWLASLDVGAAGMAMGIAVGTNLFTVYLISVLTGILALCGLLLGSKISRRSGRYAEITGGTILLSIALCSCIGR